MTDFYRMTFSITNLADEELVARVRVRGDDIILIPGHSSLRVGHDQVDYLSARVLYIAWQKLDIGGRARAYFEASDVSDDETIRAAAIHYWARLTSIEVTTPGSFSTEWDLAGPPAPIVTVPSFSSIEAAQAWLDDHSLGEVST
jgi:hypothetical protein